MPKQPRRRSSKEAVLSGLVFNDGSRLERKSCRKSTEICNELLQVQNNEPLQVQNNELLQVQNNELLQVQNNELLQVQNNEPLQVQNNELLQVQNNELLQVKMHSDTTPVLRVPEVTITPEGGGSSRTIQQCDWDDVVDGGLRRKLSNSSISSTGSSVVESEDDILSDNESKSKGIITLEHLVESGGEQSKAWWKLKAVVNLPFVTSQRRRLKWVQLAGHKGNFKAADEGTILKKFSENEKQCFERLRGDALQAFVPAYLGVLERDGEAFLHMTDLLTNFDRPNVMDCKIGIRTYLEEELVRARERPKLRRDLYEKMMEVDSEGPTELEHSQKAVTKPRYMQWRETMSSTHTLGFRIEGIKKCDGTCRTDFKKTHSREDVRQVFRDYVGGSPTVVEGYRCRLTEIQQALQTSEFFKRHEVIGSSLLFIHDHTGRTEAWLIDFGKTTALPEGEMLRHNVPWKEGNREDGYLWGLKNLIQTLESVNTAESGEAGTAGEPDTQ